MGIWDEALRPTEAMELFEKSKELWPDRPNRWFPLCVLFYDLKEEAEIEGEQINFRGYYFDVGRCLCGGRDRGLGEWVIRWCGERQIELRGTSPQSMINQASGRTATIHSIPCPLLHAVSSLLFENGEAPYADALRRARAYPSDLNSKVKKAEFFNVAKIVAEVMEKKESRRAVYCPYLPHIKDKKIDADYARRIYESTIKPFMEMAVRDRKQFSIQSLEGSYIEVPPARAKIMKVLRTLYDAKDALKPLEVGVDRSYLKDKAEYYPAMISKDWRGRYFIPCMHPELLEEK